MTDDAPLENNKKSRPKPLVLLLIDGWGVALKSEANILSSAKTPTFLNLIKEYPVAVLRSGGKNINSSYLSLGAGQEIIDENAEPIQGLTKIISENKLSQIKISETERFAALTHFFNLHSEKKEIGEDWAIVTSESSVENNNPALALRRSYKEIAKAVEGNKYDFIVVSWPLLDLVSSRGDLKSVKKAAEVVDTYLKKLLIALQDKGGVLIISSTHGNAERMKNIATELVDNEMNDNPIPFLIVGEEFKGKTIGLIDTLDNDLSLLEPVGSLADIAPTILKILDIEKPEEMTGHSLI